MQPVDLIYRAAARQPDAVAVEAPGVFFRYRELITRADAPKQVHFVDSLPRSAVGKVLRREVRALTERGEGR